VALLTTHPCLRSIVDAVKAHPKADVFINFASMRRRVLLAAEQPAAILLEGWPLAAVSACRHAQCYACCLLCMPIPVLYIKSKQMHNEKVWVAQDDTLCS